MKINTEKALEQLELIRQHVKRSPKTAITKVRSKAPKDPFKVLTACILSLRTKDEVTAPAAERLFQVAPTPEKLAAMKEEKIADIIRPVGFYRVKARNLKKIASILLDNHNGKVPKTLDQLLALPGVGRKTANLVLGRCFAVPAICVDTHVHRVSNRLGWVSTKNPEATEKELQKLFPPRHWIELNDILVRFGKETCRPMAPRCPECPLRHQCPSAI